MKKVITKITLLTLILVMILSLAACTDGKGNDNPGREELSSEKFTVTFNSDGGSIINPTVVYVPNNGLVQEPVSPTKSGYTFKHWSLNSNDRVNPFNFNEERITKNITLTAIWEADSNEHELAECKPANTDGYTVVSAGDPKSVDGKPATKYTYKSVFHAKNDHPILLLKKDNTLIENGDFHPTDYFCYFYITDKNQKEQRFTTWAKKPPTKDFDPASKEQAFVTELEPYNSSTGVRLYAKWHSQLPLVRIVVKDNTIDPDWIPQNYSTLKFHDEAKTLMGIITNTEDNTNIVPKRDGYVFDGWKFVKTDKDGKETVKDLIITDSTQPLDEYYLEKEVNNGTETGNYTLTIRANWRKIETITTAGEFEAFANKVIALQNEVAQDPENTAKVDELKKYCNAKITLSGPEFDFTEIAAIQPIFTSNYPFSGKIETEGNTEVVFKNLTLTNKDNLISLFGYLDSASIKLIHFKDVIFNYDASKDKVDNGKTYVAALANFVLTNSKIENCDLIKTEDTAAFDFKSGEKANAFVVYGGLVSHLERSQIFNSNVTFNFPVFVSSSQNAIVGALVGEQQYKASEVVGSSTEFGDIRNSIVKGNLNITVEKNLGKAKVGGVVGALTQNAIISSTRYTGNIIVDGADVMVGGLVGYLDTSKVVDSYTKDLSIAVGGKLKEKIKSQKRVYVGGLIGRAETYKNYTVVSTSFAHFAADGIQIHAYKDCKVYSASIIGNATNTTINKSFALPTKIDVNIYEIVDATQGTFKLVDLSKEEDLKALVKENVRLGYLFSANTIGTNAAKETTCYYILHDEEIESEYQTKELITLNGILHEITMKAPAPDQDQVKTSNLDIALNVGRSYEEHKFYDKKLFIEDGFKKQVDFDGSRWTWEEGSLPRLIIEKPETVTP